MNRKIGMIGSLVNSLTVLAFAIFMLMDWTYGSFFVCILLSLSFICMVAALYTECPEDRKAAGRIAMVMSAVY
ncbi:MAG: hypothetical protein J5626_10005, partial [Lachnospiraceae bacterium]|nr:hypothetical protein [Lachnospiraceae bacterium]